MRILYNKDKWLDIYNSSKYQDIRNKILDTFKGLSFIEEGHKYFLNGKEMECVSNVTHMFQEHIDTVKLATQTYERNFNKESSKYYRMTVEQIIEQWKKISSDACTNGTFHHEFGESCFYYMTGQYEKILPEFKNRLTEDGGFKAIHPKEESVVKFYEEIPRCIVPILAETRVFVEYGKSGYAGTFDILFYYDAELNDGKCENNGLMVLDFKGLDITTPIFTKNKGWITMETIDVGDIVFDKNGEETKVLHTSSIHNKKCYKIKFDNKVEIIADYDHRWEITYKGHKKNKIDIMTTEELFNYCESIKYKRISGNIPCVNISKPLKSTNNYDVDPYLLGVWLSDENFYNKNVPSEVLTSDFDYKKQVLCGLMDNCGYYNNNSKRFAFYTINLKQKEFIVQLLSSMGIKCTVIFNLKRYVITFTCDFNPFLFKKIEANKPKNENNLKANIISVTECNSVPTRCIEVDSPTHTFLYGHNFMVTHNTNKDLYKNFKEQKLLYPFEELLDMPLSIYKLQLSLYENALYKIGLKVVGRRIIWLKENKEYEKINLESYRQKIDDELKKIFDK